jgi:acylpyruvate hydrolase
MRLVTYEHLGSVRSGALTGEWVVDLARSYARILREEGTPAADRKAEAVLPPDLRGVLEGGEESLEAARRVLSAVGTALEPSSEEWRRRGLAFRRDEVRLWPPIPRPGKIICLGRNYLAHAQEGGGKVPEVPELFAKFANTLIGDGWPIRLPVVSDRVDYEAELAVVMGRRAYRVPEDRALEHVAGYTILNDVSARDYQRKTSQWLAGKGMDTFGPMGPWLVTADEIPDPQRLQIRLEIGGQVLQDANTSDMVYSVAVTVAYISSIMTLEPGDVIATGTPEGVGFARKPPIYLKAGDVVRITIDGVGTLSNPVEDERQDAAAEARSAAARA